MGARKLKWTEEEETALKAGVDKYGTGKWRTILKDPDFGGILKARSNVDLKDKWRNMNAIVNHPNNNNARGVSREQRVSRKNTVKKPSKSSSSSSLDSPTLALPGPVAEPIRPNNATVNGNAANDIENQQGQWQVGTSNGGQECNVQLANGGVSDFASANYEEVVMDCLRVSQGSMDVNGIFEILRNQYDFPVYYKELVPSTLDGLVSKGLVEKSEDCRYSLKLASSDCPMDELYFGWEWDQFEVPPSPDQGGLDIPEIELGLEEQAKLESELFLDGQQQPIADDPVSYSSLFDQFLATGIVTI